ncbi:unnamed protein product [Brassica oleracea]
MSHRLSRSDKGKWISDLTKPTRRPPFKIPVSNNRDLIEEHKLTLIGRVTNPKIQKTRTLDFIVEQGRIRVMINGLKPLETNLEIDLAGELKQVVLEYEQLQKHYFSCRSLSHEKEDCPSLKSRAGRDDRAPPSLSQSRTLEKLDADKRRKDLRKCTNYSSGMGYRPQEDARHRTREIGGDDRMEEEWRRDKIFRHDYGVRRNPYHREDSSNFDSREFCSRPPARERLSFNRDNSSLSQGASTQSRQLPPQKREWRQVADSSQVPRVTPVRSTRSQNPVTPEQPHQTSHQKSGHRSGKEPTQLSASGDNGGSGSQGRKSALQRLSCSGERVPLLQDGIENAASGRLQEVDIQFMEDNLPLLTGDRSVLSTSRNSTLMGHTPDEGITDRSPIRTLSEDRIHVSLRLGPLYPTEDSNHQRRGKRAAADDDDPLLLTNNETAEATKKQGGQISSRG